MVVRRCGGAVRRCAGHRGQRPCHGGRRSHRWRRPAPAPGRPPRWSAAASWPPPETARFAIPRRKGRPTPAGWRWRRRSARLYSTNITPDVATGIGNWSFTAFDRAMRQGIARDGRHLYPAFPYTAFSKMTDGDMQALYAYLMSQPAVRQSNPANQMRFPFNLRPLMAGLERAVPAPGEFQPDPQQSAQWNRGAYLVNGLGHCAACHSPRNLLGAEKGRRGFPGGGWWTGGKRRR